MPLVAAYYRPDSLDEALSLLAEPNRVPLAGGTVVNADREPSEIEVVDLQALGLGGVEHDGDRVRLGATATLADVADAGIVPEWLRDVARAELPSTLRTLATVGGTVASPSGESVLLAALLVSDAQVELAGTDDRPLPDVLRDGVPEGALITAVTIDPSGQGAVAATGRTPGDVPIVAAVARRRGDGEIVSALTGVGDVPSLHDPAPQLAPPADFRGSSEYRLELARVLHDRATGAVR